MTELVWGNPEDKIYEVGVDRGVLYLPNGTAVPWNGLRSVEASVVLSSESYFYDGVKRLEVATSEDFIGKIKALTYPIEFEDLIGYSVVNPLNNFQIANQDHIEFGMSYRTLIGDDDVGLDLGYKIHLLYNLVVDSSDVTRNTVDTNIDPIEFSWNVTGRPEELKGFVPTAYIVLDSRHMAPHVLERIEEVLYGTDSTAVDPTLPSPSELIDLNYTYIITDNGDGTWTADGPDEFISELEPGMFQLLNTNAVYLDPDTYEISSS